jgi:hypothetical protein
MSDSRDTKWTTMAAIAYAASGIVEAVVNIKKRPDNDPELHERVALLEKRLSDLEGKP